MRLVHSLALAATCVGCTNQMHEDDTDIIGRDVSSLRAETSRHHAHVMAAPTLEDVVADATHHDRNIDETMARMSSHMSGMSSCSGGGMSMMHGKMKGITLEMAEHLSAMQESTDIESARGACSQHTAAMNDMLDAMGEAVHTMGCM